MKTLVNRLKLKWLLPGLILLFSVPASGEEDWFTSLYVGQFSNTALNENVRFQTSFEDSYVYVLSLGKELTTIKEILGLELEGQIGVHSGLQDNGEANLAFTLRWLPLPWDKYLDTSFAFGNGVSYATANPPLEEREGDDNRTSQWLYYILVEASFALPQKPQWNLFARVHHRSSVFGAIDGIFTGSNFVGLGLRYKF
jgi:hypothetical protein